MRGRTSLKAIEGEGGRSVLGEEDEEDLKSVIPQEEAGVSILTSYGENPHYVKLPIFSDLWKTQPNL